MSSEAYLSKEKQNNDLPSNRKRVCIYLSVDRINAFFTIFENSYSVRLRASLSLNSGSHA